MEEVIVTTKEELEKAIENKVAKIIVKGPLAKKVARVNEFKKIPIGAIVLLGGLLAAAPFTRGLSLIGVPAIPVVTGISVSLIIIAVSIGIAVITSVLRGEYRVVEKVIDKGGEVITVVLRQMF